MYKITVEGSQAQKNMMLGSDIVARCGLLYSSAPNGAVFLAPVYEGSVDDIKREMEKKVNGIGIKTSVVAECIVGYLGFRKFDNTLSLQAKRLRIMSEEKSKS